MNFNSFCTVAHRSADQPRKVVYSAVPFGSDTEFGSDTAASTHHPLVTTDSTHKSDDGKQLTSASTDNPLVSTQSIEKSDDDRPHDVDFLSAMGK